MSVPGSQMLREIYEIPEVLKSLSSRLVQDSVARSLFKKHNFKSVVILARGTSDNAAHFLKYLIELKLGLPVALASPSIATMYNSQFHYEETLLVAISQSGQSLDLISFAHAAKSGGAFILSITNDAQSPLAQLSDHHIFIGAGLELAVPATKSYAGQIMASYLLTMFWSESPIKTEEIVSNCNFFVEDKFKYQEFAKNLDLNNPIYVLGRGFSYPNAKEFALKLQETCLIPVQGMSTSDFMHGPIASLNENSQVIFIAPEHLPVDSFGEVPSRVRAITGKLFWIGASKFAKDGELVLSGLKSTSEITASISDIVAFQKVTHYLATSNGLDPDSPRGLNKVTITR